MKTHCFFILMPRNYMSNPTFATFICLCSCLFYFYCCLNSYRVKKFGAYLEPKCFEKIRLFSIINRLKNASLPTRNHFFFKRSKFCFTLLQINVLNLNHNYLLSCWTISVSIDLKYNIISITGKWNDSATVETPRVTREKMVNLTPLSFKAFVW